MAIRTRHFETTFPKGRDHRAVIHPSCHLDRLRSLTCGQCPLDVDQREMIFERSGTRQDHHVTRVRHGESRERFTDHPTPDRERIAAEPTKEPLQTAGMKEGVRIGGRARVTDRAKQLEQVTLKVKTAFREV